MNFLSRSERSTLGPKLERLLRSTIFRGGVVMTKAAPLDRGQVPVHRRSAQHQQAAVRARHELMKEPRRFEFASLFPSRPRVTQPIQNTAQTAHVQLAVEVPSRHAKAG